MSVRELAWGVLAWPVAGLLLLLASPGDGDVSIESMIGLLTVMVAAYSAAGALLWLPASVWLSRVTRAYGQIRRGVAFGALGFALGFIVMMILALASGNFTVPNTYGVVLGFSVSTAAASLAGWVIAINLARRRAHAGDL
jgi:hypothetical protein